ncbi:hypothetical protein [Actinomadura miaoliensis]|uniref:Uncharacterized protein n=1 Tax=Actinomadura miaoliensis TaxID=430685 RepID=A0ABP7W7L4_9ACTN
MPIAMLERRRDEYGPLETLRATMRRRMPLPTVRYVSEDDVKVALKVTYRHRSEEIAWLPDRQEYVYRTGHARGQMLGSDPDTAAETIATDLGVPISPRPPQRPAVP